MPTGAEMTSAQSNWTSLWILLSTDWSGLLIPAMGLALDDLTTVRRCARTYVQAFANASDGTAQVATLLQQTQDRLSRARPDTAERLARWSRECLHWSQDDPIYVPYAWRRLLWRLAGIFEGQIVPLALPPERVGVIQNAVSQHLGDEFEQLQSTMRILGEQPKSDWDEFLYRLYREGVLQGASPSDILLDAITQYRCQHVWELIYTILTVEEQAVLLEWGCAQSIAMGYAPPTALPARHR